MRRNVFIMATALMVSMACTSVFAQGRGRGVWRDRHDDRIEMRHHRPEPPRHHRPEPPRRHLPAYGRPCPDDRGYLPGWHGRVRYMDGRWGYLRGRDWYWYDVYYEPDYYFSHPVAHFHGHLSPAGKVVAGAVGAAAVGAFIGALCR